MTRRIATAQAAAGLLALLLTLTGCTGLLPTPHAESPAAGTQAPVASPATPAANGGAQPTDRCGNAPDPATVARGLAGLSLAYAGVTYDAATNTLSMRGYYPENQSQLDDVLAALRPGFTCTKVNVSISSDWAAMVPQLGLREVLSLSLDLSLPGTWRAADLASLAHGPAIDSVTLVAYADTDLAGAAHALTLLPEGLSPKLFLAWPGTGKLPIANLVKAFPGVTSFAWTVSEGTTWNPGDFKAWTQLAELNVGTGTSPNSLDLSSSPAKTADLVFNTVQAMPSLTTVNGIELASWTPSQLRQILRLPRSSGTTTMAAQLQADQAQREADLAPWVDSYKASKWRSSGAITSIAGPIVVVLPAADDPQQPTDSISAGVQSRAFGGIPATALCLSKYDCTSIVDVSVRAGAATAPPCPYQGGVTITPHYGETVVRVWNVSQERISTPVVVAKTKPKDPCPTAVTVPTGDSGSGGTVAGPINLKAAYAYIKAHIK